MQFVQTTVLEATELGIPFVIHDWMVETVIVPCSLSMCLRVCVTHNVPLSLLLQKKTHKLGTSAGILETREAYSFKHATSLTMGYACCTMGITWLGLTPPSSVWHPVVMFVVIAARVSLLHGPAGQRPVSQLLMGLTTEVFPPERKREIRGEGLRHAEAGLAATLAIALVHFDERLCLS